MRQPTTTDHEIYFITTVVYERQKFFIRVERAEEVGNIIKNSCRMKDFSLLAYCILPDHVHILVQKLPSTDKPLVALEKAPLRENNKTETMRNLKQGLSSPPPRRYAIPALMQSIKGNFSWRMNDGKLWQDGYDARIVETQERLENTVQYIMYNYRKLNLPEAYSQNPFVYCDWHKIKTLM